MDSIRKQSIEQCIKQINDYSLKGGKSHLLTSGIGSKNGLKTRSYFFCLDRFWAWLNGVEFGKDKVVDKIIDIFQGLDQVHTVNVSKVELNVFLNNIVALDTKFSRGTGKKIEGLTAIANKVSQYVHPNQSQGSPRPPATSSRPMPSSKMSQAPTSGDDSRRCFTPAGHPTTTSPTALSTSSVSPTAIRRPRGIPNYRDNCFLISAYQLVKSDEELHRRVFDSFRDDPRFESLQAFDAKYDSASRLTADDMHRVRKECLTRFGIPRTGHQDAQEALTLALFQNMESENSLQYTGIYEFMIPATQVQEVIENIEATDGVKVVSREERGGQCALRVQKQFKRDPVGHIVDLALPPNREPTLQQAFAAGFQKEGEAPLEESSYNLELSSGYRLERGRQIEREADLSVGQKVLISLKRFDFSRGYEQKIDKKVKVPGGRVQLDKSGKAHEITAFIVHRGSVRGGHYYEYHKVGNQWYCNNDSLSKRVTEKEALSAMERAYILLADRGN